MKVEAPELRALIIIFRSTGPVISIRGSASAGGDGATCQVPARMSAVSSSRVGRWPASRAACRPTRASSKRSRVGLKARCNVATNATASAVSTGRAHWGTSPTISTSGDPMVMMKCSVPKGWGHAVMTQHESLPALADPPLPPPSPLPPSPPSPAPGARFVRLGAYSTRSSELSLRSLGGGRRRYDEELLMSAPGVIQSRVVRRMRHGTARRTRGLDTDRCV